MIDFHTMTMSLIKFAYKHRLTSASLVVVALIVNEYQVATLFL